MPLRVPKLFNLRTDPFERADITSNTYYDWFLYHAYMIWRRRRSWPQFLATFKEFPPRQKAASFTIDQAHGEDGARPPAAPDADGRDACRRDRGRALTRRLGRHTPIRSWRRS